MSNDSIFVRRPNKYDDEDELIRQNQEFVKANKNTLAAKPVKVQTNDLSTSASKSTEGSRKSRFAQSRMKKDLKREHKEISQQHDSIQTPDNTVLKDSVVEKMIMPQMNGDVEMADNLCAPDKEKFAKVPFPEAKIWNKDILEPKMSTIEGKKKKVSIFAQQLLIEGIGKEIDSKSKTSTPMVVIDSHDRNWGLESRLFKNARLKNEDNQIINEIHKENVIKLNSMSEEQIMASQKEIIEKVDPSLLAFLKNKKKNYVKNTDELSAKSISQQVEPIEIDKLENNSEIEYSLNNRPSAKEKYPENLNTYEKPQKYLNMNKIETDKMEWMSEINETDKQKTAKESFNARFDFNGNLLPFKDDSIPVTAALHHHGDEPDRPGYTLEELLTLARSINPKQRSIAFDTLSNIIQKSKEGRYDFCFGTKLQTNTENDNDIKESHINVLVELLEADIVTLLRLTIDESAHTSALVLDSSINCLAQIIDNQVEEIALDKQFFVSFDAPRQPCLKTKICTDPEFLKDEKEMKDIQILKSDLILGLIRMDLLDRFSYLLSVTRPSNPTVLNILKILSRMCRHSIQTVSTIMNHSKLISVVIDNFLPSGTTVHNSTSIYHTPVHSALKLIRIIMGWGRGFSSEILDKFDLTSRLLAYCSLVPGESSNPVHHVQGKI